MNLGPFRSRRLVLLAVVVAAGTISAAAFVFWNASSVLNEAAIKLNADSEIPFSVRHLDAANTAQPAATDTPAASAAFEWIASPATYRDAAVLEGRIYIAGPTGLWAYAGGSFQSEYLVGARLPAAEPVQIAPGLARGISGSVLYIATAGEGLLIHDPRSKSFTQIRADQPRFRDLTAVLPLKTGQILLGTERAGVLTYDGERLAPFHSELRDLHVTTLAGSETELWVGTLDRGVIRLRAGATEAFSEPEGLPDPRVLSIATDGERTFVGTAIGVAEFEAGRFRRTLAEGFFANSLHIRNDKLLIGTLDEGIVEVALAVRPPRGVRPFQRDIEGLDSTVSRFIEADGEALAVTSDGLYRLDVPPGEKQVLTSREALLTDRNISAISFDSAGRMWVGYFDRGLDIVDLAAGYSRHIENENVFCVNRIVHDEARNRTALATANGLVLFDSAGRQQEVLRRDQGLISNHVTDIIVRTDGLTIATPAGITFFDSLGARSLYAFHGLVNNHVYALGASGDRVLAGTLGGLSVLDAGVIQAGYTTANSALDHNWITAIVPVGNEWFVGTYGAGVLKFRDTGAWEGFPVASGAYEVNPNAMLATSGRVYAGSLGRGLYVYDKAQQRWSVIVDGLPSTNVTALAAHDGYLYVGTDNGIVRASEDSLLGL